MLPALTLSVLLSEYTRITPPGRLPPVGVGLVAVSFKKKKTQQNLERKQIFRKLTLPYRQISNPFSMLSLLGLCFSSSYWMQMYNTEAAPAVTT